MPPSLTVEEAVARAGGMTAGGGRRLLGITGPPGGGKSTLAEALAARLGGRAAVVGMDGFHLAQRELERLGRADRKGAVDTFDTGGYVALLRRLRAAEEDVVYAPRFDRDLEEPIGSAVPVARDVPLVLTEGNYVLVEQGGWGRVAPLLDEVWFVAVPEDVRLERLIARHVAHGRAPEAARAWAMGTDQRNADLIATTMDRADAIVRL